MSIQQIAISTLVGISLACATSANADDWRQFRGPEGQGHAQTSGLPLDWNEKQNIVWKTAIPGKGWSSPVIAGNQIWMTTALTVEASEEEKKKRLAGNTSGQTMRVASLLSMRAICVDWKSGKITDDILLMTVKDPQPIHALNSYASPTPTIAAGRLYCHFGSYGTACLDTSTRKILWTNQRLIVNHVNGPGCTPVLHKDKLIIHYDGSDKQYIAALDTKTGNVAWKTDRSGKLDENPESKKAYGSPLVVRAEDRDLLLSQGADWLYAYDPATGNELWKVAYGKLGYSIVPKLVVGHGLVYATTCFNRSEVLAIPYQGIVAGDTPKIAWRVSRQAPRLASNLLVGDELYFVSDRGVASCVAAKTGKIHWQERIGGNYAASPILADGRIHFFSREGVCTIVKPGKTFKILGKNKIDGTFMASPAAVDGAFYFRTRTSLYRVEKSRE